MPYAHIFAAYLGVVLNVYLDNIIIYTDTLTKHVQVVKMVADMLGKEQLFLGEKKVHFLCKEIKILSHIVDDKGIHMNPSKTPMNWDVLWGFLGSVVYLANDLANIWIPMGILSVLTGDAASFCWDHVHQVPLDYSQGAPPIFLVTDASHGGLSGVMNTTQLNYAVHKQEMLAGMESMLWHRDILQARWLEKISEFNFEIEHIPGTENVLADMLSHMYSGDSPGTNDDMSYLGVTMPLLVGLEALAASLPELGQPETSCEFMQHIRKLKLIGREGGEQSKTMHTHTKLLPISSSSKSKTAETKGKECTIKGSATEDPIDVEPNHSLDLDEHMWAAQHELTTLAQSPSAIKLTSSEVADSDVDDSGLLDYIASHETVSLEEGI
ncbi:DNA/RNA polymerase [Neolentinus lepideus HHB14362 ss-1]|uniref:DNA/RNA polymerase n=1 Tax=Neolentinus lepideus HHB14362 ss-1 TaxID=1314782 RepID=A0A165NG93_9AGAM|nr:DNA/RNA polymerase [Neolentinus lepideus HHB14362 ss-1]